MAETPVPLNVVTRVDQYVEKRLDEARKYDNSEPLDESGIWSLHRLAADIYAEGFTDGVTAEGQRSRAKAERQHTREAADRG